MDAPSPSLDPIEGVSLSTFVAVSRDLSRVGYDAERAGELALELGIAPEAWAAAAAGWTARLRASEGVADEFARLYHRGWDGR